MASTTSKAGQNGSASASTLDGILRLLVTRPGRRRQDRQALEDLAWLVNFAAQTFEGDPGEGTWPTLDMVACGAEKSGGTLDPDRVVDNIRFLPPLLGFVDKAERVHLTALGLLLSKKAERKADQLAKLARECYLLKLASSDGSEPGQQKLPLLAAESSVPTGLASMLPGVSVTRDPAGESRLVLDRTVLGYRALKKAADGDLRNVLTQVLADRAVDRLIVDRRPIDRLQRQRLRLMKWLRLLGSVSTGAEWPREETVDPGPPWLPGNDPDPGPAQDSPDPPADQRDYLATLLGAYSAQFGSYTTLLWQVPALSLTAQAFLMTIALDYESSSSARIISAVLSAVIAITSISLMHNHRGHAINFGELALRVSARLHLTRDFGRLAIHDAKPEFTDAEHVWVGWDRHIYHVWKICLGLFIVADVIVVLLTIADAVWHKSFGHL